ncbi:hypothetical protein ACHHYP_20300 [Achlya hypogyna]|uniref:Uncharacterized protein n=1 Tax=Achlya hypogyna TaxID=1202772 RepID=A0A1V9YRZ4_ACHHY|nr:hypothetical protein ACHHYP_20300 [Achlya hypogyna]
MSKGFAYVFNTTKEDERVAKVLSGHRANATVAILDFSTFDDTTRVELDLFRETLYQTCLGFSDQRYKVPLRLLETMTAYLIRSYPVLSVVSFMRLFAEDGYVLDPSSSTYRSSVTDLGTMLESKAIAYLKAAGVHAVSGGTVEKTLRRFHKEGALDSRIVGFERLQEQGRIVDPSPPSTFMKQNHKKM